MSAASWAFLNRCISTVATNMVVLKVDKAMRLKELGMENTRK